MRLLPPGLSARRVMPVPLHRLAGYRTWGRSTSARRVSPGLLLVLDRLADTPAQVLSDSGQVLARNAMAEALFGAPALPGRAGNAIWRMFVDRGSRRLIPEDLHPEVGPLALASEVLLDSTGEQSLVLYTAQPGTNTAEKLELLRVLGREKFAEPWEVR